MSIKAGVRPGLPYNVVQNGPRIEDVDRRDKLAVCGSCKDGTAMSMARQKL
ncbi:MAG: hypothetical protein ACK4SY_08880 [Pyrobaculum sp.]